MFKYYQRNTPNRMTYKQSRVSYAKLRDWANCCSYRHVCDCQPLYRSEHFTVSRNCTLSVLWTTFTLRPLPQPQHCSLTCLSVLAHRPGLRRHRISLPFATCRGARKGHGPQTKLLQRVTECADGVRGYDGVVRKNCACGMAKGVVNSNWELMFWLDWWVCSVLWQTDVFLCGRPAFWHAVHTVG
jgi:hypothetical protein